MTGMTLHRTDDTRSRPASSRIRCSATRRKSVQRRCREPRNPVHRGRG